MTKIKTRLFILSFLFTLVLFLYPADSFAAEIPADASATPDPGGVTDDAIRNQLGNLDLSSVGDALAGTPAAGMDMTDMVVKAIKGELGLTPGTIAAAMLKNLFSEVSGLLYIIKNVIIMAILSAILTNISSSFKNKTISELGFYVNFVIVVTLLLSSFGSCVGIMTSFAGDICRVIEAMVPVMAAAAALAGSGVKAYILSPALLSASGFVIFAAEGILAPAIMAAASLQIVNCLTEKEILQKMSELIKKILTWAMRITAVLFMGAASVSGLSAPIVNNLAVRSAKFAISAVPVVGAAFSGAVDAALQLTGAVRSGFLIVAIIALVLICAVPVIKITAFILIYKAAAALIEPICDKRIVKVIDSAGGYASLALSACVIVSVMFIFMTIIMLTA